MMDVGVQNREETMSGSVMRPVWHCLRSFDICQTKEKGQEHCLRPVEGPVRPVEFLTGIQRCTSTNLEGIWVILI
jgi:hypothetical protein